MVCVIKLQICIKYLCEAMINKHPTDSATHDLSHKADLLNEAYFKEIQFICTNALNYIAQVVEMDIHGSMALNVVLCEQLIDEVLDLIEYKRQNFLSYLFQLSEKQTDDHDCRSCSGKCYLEHSTQLMNLKESNKKIEAILFRLQTEGTPLRDIDYPQLYGALRNQMSRLENKLRELFIFEEANLIPGVIIAQQHIHVYPKSK